MNFSKQEFLFLAWHITLVLRLIISIFTPVIKQILGYPWFKSGEGLQWMLKPGECLELRAKTLD
jgi:hypothetical protein